MSKHGLQVIENDALVVLAFKHDWTGDWVHTHHSFGQWLHEHGIRSTKSKVHSMLSRAKGRVATDGKTWHLTAAGIEYRRHVVHMLTRLVGA